MYVTPQQTENLKNNGYVGIHPGTCVHYFIGGIDQPSLKITVQTAMNTCWQEHTLKDMVQDLENIPMNV